MASAASSSNIQIDTSSNEESRRQQAGPLPSKRGEIGFVEGVDTQDEARSESPEVVLPERHPADRDGLAGTIPAVTSLPTPLPSASNPLVSPSTSTLVSNETGNSTAKKHGVLCFFKPKKISHILGFSLTTLLLFFFQLALIGGSITGWVLIVQLASRKKDVFNTTVIFVHVIFGVTILAQLLFLERRVYRLRGERYSYIHPGQILPSSRNRRGADPDIAFSPWNRPPLPTYAAALAQSGVGTGDVEDHLIAVPPPPAYGNTRGSTLLLAGFLRNSLRAQRPSSGQSQTSERERPISYASRDDEWETIQDADRAQRLEETLARLERPTSRS